MVTEREIRTPLVIAHRGASRDFPENTVAAFRGAVDQGADWIELDVRRTADGVLVVTHDPTVPVGDSSMTETLRPVSGLAAADLPPSVPTLADALAASEHLGVNVEIKNDEQEPGFDPQRRIADAVLEVIAASGRPARAPVLVSSFDLRSVERVRALDPDLPTGLLTVTLPPERVERVVELAVSHGCVALHPGWWDVDEHLVATAHDAGLAVNVWTVDEPEHLAQLAALGVDGLITNVPAVARAVLDG